jgi:cell division protein FtsB
MHEVSADLAAGVPNPQICAKYGITPQELERVLRQFDHDNGKQARLKQLEDENRQLRRAVANLELEKKALAEAVRGNL